MTSEERKQGRYLRRKARREQKKRQLYPHADNYEKVFSQRNLRKAFRQCERGVKWKGSVQRYSLMWPIYISQTHRRLMNGRYKCKKLDEFDVYERGVKRHIMALKFYDRVPQRCYCNGALVPLVTRSFIYDNGACQKGKGYHWAANRLEAHLHQHYREHGTEGYIWIYDFSNFFGNVEHDRVDATLHRAFTDPRLIMFSMSFVKMFGEKGLGLGSPIDHILALAAADALDHYIKEELRIKRYARYNDDGYIIFSSKEEMQRVVPLVEAKCAELSLKLNTRKTHAVRLTRGFSWLKARWFLTSTGKVLRKIYKKSVVRMRRKMKKFPGLIARGELDYEHAYLSYQSWRGYAKHFDAYHTLQSLDRLWRGLFGKPPATRRQKAAAKKELTEAMRKTAAIRSAYADGRLTKSQMLYFAREWDKQLHTIRSKQNLSGLGTELQITTTNIAAIYHAAA